MINDADISENQFLHSYGEKVCMNLLKDHTTQQNIYWATDSYADYGEDFTFFAPITLDKITSYASKEGKVITKEQYKELVKKNPEEKDNYQEIIRPRAVKSKEEQTQRAKDKAEVFTHGSVMHRTISLMKNGSAEKRDSSIRPTLKTPRSGLTMRRKLSFQKVRPGKTMWLIPVWRLPVAKLHTSVTDMMPLLVSITRM